jgi:hypothetical protein
MKKIAFIFLLIPLLVSLACGFSTPSTSQTPTETPPPNQPPTLTPELTQPGTISPPAEASFTIIKVTRTVKVGDNAQLEIQTNPGDDCDLKYVAPDGKASTASGLGKTATNQFGQCIWKLRISLDTSPGAGQITITVNGQSQTKPITITK